MPKILRDRKLVVCGICGWVHYAMTTDEKARHDRVLERYPMDSEERHIYESEFRQCLRCESPLEVFRDATERDLDRARGHIVTTVLLQEG
jgi:hypothetical protein